MRTCTEIRLDNLRILIKEAGGPDALANAYGCTAPFIKQMARGYKDSKSGTPKGIGDSAARMLETVMRKDRGWMDHDHPTLSYDKPSLTAEEPASNALRLFPERRHDDHPAIVKVVQLMLEMSDAGKFVLIGRAQEVAAQWPKANLEPSSQ